MLVSLQRTHQNLKPPGSSQNWSEDLALRLRILTEVRAKSLTFASPARQEEGPEGPEGPRRGPHGRTTSAHNDGRIRDGGNGDGKPRSGWLKTAKDKKK